MTKEEEIKLEEFLKQVSTPPGADIHSRKANMFMCNDIIFSRDLHVIDVLTQRKNEIDINDWNKWRDDVFKIINNPRISPLVGIVENEDGISLYNYGGETANIFKIFIHSKANSFILQKVAIEIRDKYRELWKSTIPSKPNIILSDILESYNSFIVVEDMFDDMSIIGNIINTTEYVSKIINFKNIKEFILKYTNKDEQLYTRWFTDIPWKIEEELKSVNIPEENMKRLFIETIILTMNRNTMNFYYYVQNNPDKQVFPLLVYEVFDSYGNITKVFS
jgi:hypothetical protein